MNQRQKEVLQSQLNDEKAVLKALEQNYEDALSEIYGKIAQLMARDDADMQHVIYQVQYQEALKTQVQSILEVLQTNEFETLSEYLSKAYEEGFLGAMYDMHGQGIPLIFPIDQAQVMDAIMTETNLSEELYKKLGKDIKDLQKKIAGEISRGMSTGMMYGDMARNIAGWAKIPQNNAMRIARTESHRIQCKAAYDAQHKAKSRGANVVKQWDATLDGKTRDSHRDIDGEIREIDEPFSNRLQYPGDPSGAAGEVINCRCALLQRARWALGEDDLKRMKERSEYFELDKTKNFDDFKKKYLQEAERVQSDSEYERKISDFLDALKKGDINTKLRWRKQAEHIEGTKENEIRMKEDAKNGKTPASIFFAGIDIQQLLDEYCTKGEMVFMPNQEYPIEFVSVENPVGKVYNIGKGKYEETDRIVIRYSSKGVHLHPVKRR